MRRNRIDDYLSESLDHSAETPVRQEVPPGFIEISLDLLPPEMREGMLENQHLYEVAYRQARGQQR